MSASYSDNATAHAASESDDFLNLLQRLRADIEFRTSVEGARPCVVNVRLGGAEGYVGVGALKLNVEARRHRECIQWRGRHLGPVVGVVDIF